MRSFKKHRPRMQYTASNGVNLFVYGLTLHPRGKKLRISALWRWENDRHRKMRETVVHDVDTNPYIIVGSEHRRIDLQKARVF